jgi:hypothetical protein
MIKVIKRTTDNKFLKSIQTDTWVDNVKDAFEMTHRECESTKTNLLNTYASEQIIEVVNMFKSKAMSKEEIKELRNLLKK